MEQADELNEYFKERIKGHKYAFHYTSLKVIDIILESKTFRISSVNRFNDTIDKNQFGEEIDQKKHFSLCFSTGKNENLSLWYLYSGIDGKGGRIGFTYKRLKKMIDASNFYLTEYDYDKNKSLGIQIPLKFGENATIKFQDVLYSRKTKGSKNVDLKYNTMTNYGKVSIEEFEKYKKINVGFDKGIVWYYEKESRLLIKLIGDAEKMIDQNKEYAILWKLTDEQIKNMAIMFAPEISDKSELKNYKNINDFIFTSSRTSLSDNAGNIKMNLCSRCDYKNYKKTFCSKCDNKFIENEKEKTK